MDVDIKHGRPTPTKTWNMHYPRLHNWVSASGGENCYKILNISHLVCGSLWDHPHRHKAGGQWGEITIRAEATWLNINENQALQFMDRVPQERCQKWQDHYLHRWGENSTAVRAAHLMFGEATYHSRWEKWQWSNNQTTCWELTNASWLTKSATTSFTTIYP